MTNLKRWYPALAAVCLIVPALRVNADTAAEAKKAIQAQYDKIDLASARKDAAGVMACFTKDRVYTRKGVKQTPDEERKHMAEDFAIFKSLSAKTAITSITIKNSTAVVHAKEHGAAVSANPNTDGTSPLVIDAVYVDTWIKRGGTWLQK